MSKRRKRKDQLVNDVEEAMEYPIGERIFGVETEFGCLVADESLGRPEQAVELIKDHLFYEMKIGLLDRHARDGCQLVRRT